MSTAVARPSRHLMVRMLATSAWLVLVLVGLQTAWAGFAVAAVLARQLRWRVVAVVSGLTSIAMWPAHNGPWFATGHLDEATLARVYLATWTVLCLVAVVLNAHILSSRAAPEPATPGTAHLTSPAESPTSRSRGGAGGPRPEPEPTSDGASGRGRRATALDDLPAWGAPAASPPLTEPIVQDRVDVNIAPSAGLRALPGVSRSAARRAVQHRRQVGAFQSLDEFAQVAKIEGTDLLRLRERASCAPSDR